MGILASTKPSLVLNMKDLYNRTYLLNTLDIISDNFDDLEKWSVWNHDEKLDEIKQIQEVFELVKEQLKKGI